MSHDGCGPRNSSAPTAPPLLDGAFLAEQFGDDPALLERLFAHYARELPALVATIRDAAERGDLERSAAAAHTLKGISATVGAAAVARDARRILEACRREDRATLKCLFGSLEADAAETLEFALEGMRVQRPARPEGGS